MIQTILYILKCIAAKCLRIVVALMLKDVGNSGEPATTIVLPRVPASTSRGSNSKGSSVQSKTLPSVPVAVYLPKDVQGGSTLPTVINLHGSGFLMSTFGEDSQFCQSMANRVQCAVLDVNYSKAPERAYPNALNDIASVLHWIEEATLLSNKLKDKGIRLKKDCCAFTGFSSGGNLALTSCVLAKEVNRLDMIKAVIAFYPSTNLAESPGKKPAVKPDKGQGGAVMPPLVRKFLYSCYVPDRHATPLSLPSISPINASAEHFPRSMTIITCQGDSLAREGQQMANKLQQERTGADGRATEEEKVFGGLLATNGVVWWEAKGQGHNWDKMCNNSKEAFRLRDFAYDLSAERLKAALQ